MVVELRSSTSAARADDADERDEAQRRAIENARRYEAFRLHPHLTLKSSQTKLYDLLEPGLAPAIKTAKALSLADGP